MRSALTLAAALSLATLGLALSAPAADARACVLGEPHETCVLTAYCPDAECTDVCLAYWYCVIECNTPPDYYCKCRPECPPPPEPGW